LIVGALAMAADVTILKRLSYDPERTIVATIGLLYIIQQSALMIYGPDARPVEAPFNTGIALPWPEYGPDGWQMIWPWGLGTTSYKLAVIGAAVLILCAVWAVMARTRFGLIMRATQADREMATAFGIPVTRVYAATFGLGAGLAALAGVLIVPIQQAHYLMGADPLLLSFIVVIIGGLGSLPGTVVAAVLIGLSDGIISVFFSPTLAKILATLLVALVLLALPAARRAHATRGFDVDDRHVITQMVWWNRQTTVVPNHRVQTVIERQTIFQRRWDLTSVVIDTAGSRSISGSGAVAVDRDVGEADALTESVIDRALVAVGVRSEDDSVGAGVSPANAD
jgi:branched-chain amino acid transport system permease protein